MHFIVGDKRAMDARRIPSSRREIEHVTLSEQSLGSHLVKDGARVDLGRHLKGHARRNIGLDQAGDYVDRRPLRR